MERPCPLAGHKCTDQGLPSCLGHDKRGMASVYPQPSYKIVPTRWHAQLALSLYYWATNIWLQWPPMGLHV
uniref:Uncharacterized protein n=1 Tax=Xenopus tropicalis TaxID=8364 RepID=A0A1B8XWT5_XENTR